MTFEPVNNVDVIAAICDTIENIALKEQLKSLGDNVKKDFCEVFEQIPHFEDLPKDYMACIKLKDMEKKLGTDLTSTLQSPGHSIWNPWNPYGLIFKLH